MTVEHKWFWVVSTNMIDLEQFLAHKLQEGAREEVRLTLYEREQVREAYWHLKTQLEAFMRVVNRTPVQR